MELEVGMYVRTKNGKIWIITSQKAISGHRKDIIKASYNIIDLIQVGDYVNGKKVINKQYHYNDEYDRDMGEWCIFYENVVLGDYQYDIKSIVTREQFSAMEYKVESEVK